MRASLRPDMISLSVLWVFFAAELGVFLAVPDLATALAIHAGLTLVVLLVGATSGLPMLQVADPLPGPRAAFFRICRLGVWVVNTRYRNSH